MSEAILSNLMGLFSKMKKTIIPLEIVIKELTNDYPIEKIESTIELALDEFQIDKVLDYAEDKWNLYGGRPLWHLLKLTPEDAEKLRNLNKVDLALLRLLKKQNTPRHEGEMKSEDARIILQEQGFTEADLRSLWVEDYTDHHYEFEDGKSIEWCRLIPEDEKTEEYKKAMEEIEEEFWEKEERRMYYADIHDLADWTLKAVRKSPEGISKKDIIKQLPDFPADYIEEGFRIATEDKEIIPIMLENGEEGYKVNPDFDEEDW